MGKTPVPAFVRDESGAVTVDWVVLTAALVCLALGVIATIAGGSKTLTCSTSDTMANLGPKNTFESSLVAPSGGC